MSKKVSEFNDASLPLSGNEFIPIVQNGLNRKTPISEIKGDVESVNGKTGEIVLNADDIDDGNTTNKFATDEQLTQIATNESDISSINTAQGVQDGLISDLRTDVDTNASDISDLNDKTESNTYYVSNNGNDANKGLKRLSPFKTLSKVMTVLSDNDVVLLECGSEFFEPLYIDGQNISVGSYGVGEKPIINGSSEINTPTLNSGNVWETTNTYVGETNGRVVLFENGIAMQPVSSISECEALPNSYVVVDGDSAPAGSYTLRFHTSDSADPNTNDYTYTTNLRDCLSNIDGSNYTKVEGIKVYYSYGETALKLAFGVGNVITDCESNWGNKHNAFISTNGLAENVTTYGCELQSEYGKNSTLFVAYASSGNNEDFFTFRNCIAINTIKKDGRKLGQGMTGWLDHCGTGNFGLANIINCYSSGIGTVVASNSNICNVINGYFEKCTDKLIFNSAPVFNIKSSFFQGIGVTDGTTANYVNNFTNSVFIKLKYASNLTGELNFNNCLFFNEFRNDGSFGAYSLMGESNTVVKVRSYGSAFLNYQFSICTSSDYLGDYNIFNHFAGSNNIRNYYDGTQYTSLLSWQTATGQDANSVYLTDAQVKTFLLTDPNTGDIMINPYAPVTWADGTTHIGVFADGTRITDKLTNKMFAHRKNDYLDKTQY